MIGAFVIVAVIIGFGVWCYFNPSTIELGNVFGGDSQEF